MEEGWQGKAEGEESEGGKESGGIGCVAWNCRMAPLYLMRFVCYVLPFYPINLFHPKQTTCDLLLNYPHLDHQHYSHVSLWDLELYAACLQYASQRNAGDQASDRSFKRFSTTA